ncbi:hypothetical protein D8Y24_08340 [Agrococcus lahaulensis]|nr:hypothetical protein D8Y24_08340 [Agrococcus lahaulensis]
MSLRHESALAWADDLSAAAEPRLGILEAYALQRHPEALAHMGDDGAGLARVAAAKGSGMAGLWLMLPALLALIAPLIGLAAILGDPLGLHRMDASTSVPIAGACFAIAAVVQAVAAGWWLRGRRERHGTLLLLGFGTALLAGLTAWAMSSAGALQAVADAGPWRVPVLIAGVLGLALGVLVLVAGSRVDAGAAEREAAERAHDGDRLRAALATIPASELDRIRADRDGAIALLVERGRIPAETGERAQRAELGTLHRIDTEARGRR